MQKPGWYLNRLRQMSLAEMTHRARKAVVNQLQRTGVFTASALYAPNVTRSSTDWLREVPNIDIGNYTRAADRVLKGYLQVFALENAMLGKIAHWNRDPRTGTEAPLLFSKGLDYRDEKLVGDIKYLWEPNRHLQLVTVAQAYKLTGAQNYLEALKAQLDSWFKQCPYLRGPNWTSSLELGIRLINWSFVWQLIGGPDCSLFRQPEGKAFQERWLRSIYQHMHFIAGNLSRFSSANNHLIGEAAGLFVAGSTWPFWDEARDWRQTGHQALVREALLQNCSDGVNREQAIWYQQFVLDLLLITALVGRAHNLEFPQKHWSRIEAMLEYLASVMDVGGNVPMIGDADDGVVVRLSQEEKFCPYRSLLATGAILYRRGDFKAKAVYLDDKTRWLLGAKAEESYGKISNEVSQLPIRRAFPEGGYYILGSDLETQREIRLIVDAGPLGYLSIAAHGHADALAFTLSVGGREFLIDPGTFAYHTRRKWRNYFRGTSAHNTLVVDGKDQSTMGGSFMWTKKTKATCESWEPGDGMDRFVGVHDGYMRLPDPVIHRREICLTKPERKIVITDILECLGTHLVQCYWHFSEACDVALQDAVLVATNEGTTIKLSISDPHMKFEIARGKADPPIGWVSRRYGVKVPTTTAVGTIRIHGTHTLCTEITCG